MAWKIIGPTEVLHRLGEPAICPEGTARQPGGYPVAEDSRVALGSAHIAGTGKSIVPEAAVEAAQELGPASEVAVVAAHSWHPRPGTIAPKLPNWLPDSAVVVAEPELGAEECMMVEAYTTRPLQVEGAAGQRHMGQRAVKDRRMVQANLRCCCSYRH